MTTCNVINTYLFHAVAFNHLTMELMVIARIRVYYGWINKDVLSSGVAKLYTPTYCKQREARAAYILVHFILYTYILRLVYGEHVPHFCCTSVAGSSTGSVVHEKTSFQERQSTCR